MSCGTLLPTGEAPLVQSTFDGVAAYAGFAAIDDKVECWLGVLVENFTAAVASVSSSFGDKVRIANRISPYYVE